MRYSFADRRSSVWMLPCLGRRREAPSWLRNFPSRIERRDPGGSPPHTPSLLKLVSCVDPITGRSGTHQTWYVSSNPDWSQASPVHLESTSPTQEDSFIGHHACAGSRLRADERVWVTLTTLPCAALVAGKIALFAKALARASTGRGMAAGQCLPHHDGPAWCLKHLGCSPQCAV